MKQIIALFAASLSLLGAQAQEEISMNLDAQSLGMGGAAMTSVSGSHSIFGNPAASAFSKAKMQFSGTYISLNDMNGYAASGFYNFDDRNLLQFGWRRYSSSYERNMIFDFGYTRRINENWGFGLIVHYQRISDVNALSADLSFLHVKELNFAEYSALRIGFKLANVGSYLENDYDVLPMNFTLGAALDTFITDAHEITAAADVEYCFTTEYHEGFQVSLGLEYNLMQLVQLRGGYHFSPENSLMGDYASVGAGLKFMQVRVDFAYLFPSKSNYLYDGHNIWSVSFGLDF